MFDFMHHSQKNQMKAKSPSYYTFIVYQNIKYRENIEKKNKEDFLLYKEMMLYKQNCSPKVGYTYYFEKINNTILEFINNSIGKEELDILLTMIQYEFVKSCNISNRQLILLNNLMKRERDIYLI
jgi:hypothetical protein